MKMENDNLIISQLYFQSMTMKPIEELTPVQLTGWQVVEILWPLNEIFRPRMSIIKAIDYQGDYEPDADRAIEQFAIKGITAWNALRIEVWRVLLERHVQMLVVALANEVAGNSVTIIPRELALQYRLPGLMLSLLHSMKLPRPAEDRKSFQLPSGDPKEFFSRN